MPFGVDPKTVLCIFYKQGNCEKGRKCKFSHDLAVERRSEKRGVYTDMREGENQEGEEGDKEEKERDDMGEWDEGALIIFSLSWKYPVFASCSRIWHLLTWIPCDSQITQCHPQ